MLDAVVFEVKREEKVACAVRRIVFNCIVLGIKYSFGRPNLEIKLLTIKTNEHLLVEKKQEGGFIDYSQYNNDYLILIVDYL